jgi:hypothetical protein
VHELRLDDATDTLGRWMAHYVAELITDAEAAEANDSERKRDKCFAAILELWRHRRELPQGKRPFEHLEPILKTLESLNVEERKTRRYLSYDELFDNNQSEEAATKDWLNTVTAVDYTARLLIRYCLMQAAKDVSYKSDEWRALAEAADLEDDIDLIVARLIRDESDLLKGSGADAVARKRLEERARRLNEFTQMSATLSSDIRRQLEVLDADTSTSVG